MKSNTHTELNHNARRENFPFCSGCEVWKFQPLCQWHPPAIVGSLSVKWHGAETTHNEKRVWLEGEGEQIRESGGIREEEAGGITWAQGTKKWWENYQQKDKRPSSARTYFKLHWPFGDCFSNTTYRVRNCVLINSAFNQCQTLLDALLLKMYVSIDSGKLIGFFFF